MAGRIEDYALIGDCESAALVGRDGSIDWLCWPRFDAGACFAALLGEEEHGRWRIAPVDARAVSRRHYRSNTMILETEFETADGVATVTDFMPLDHARSDLVRVVRGVSGQVAMHTELIIRFDYGSVVPWVSRLDDGRLRAIAGPDMITLRSSVPHHGERLTTVGDFTVSDGDVHTFVLTWSMSHLPPPESIDPLHALARTERFWRAWAKRCTYRGAWGATVMRSLLTLKALTYAPTGGIVAAPTTSLPTRIGGTRNWDYRYCWLRDATLTLLALMNAGYVDEAAAWRDWLLRAAAGSPEKVQIMYGVAGERLLPEWELGWLPGYARSQPVRVGNAAHAQLQLDVYGEVMDAMYQARLAGLKDSREAWALERALVEEVSRTWREPDSGIWEIRGPPQHFTHSKVMAWVALDRAVKSVEELGLDGPVEQWRATRQSIHDDVCARGFNERLGCFVQAYDSELIDASLLLMALVGFLPPHDPRVVATVECIERTLVAGGLVLRYDSAKTNDGLPPGEGVFLACSFWLADNYVLLDRHADAVALFERLRALANDVELLSEQYDVDRGRLLGNFPQAFSHIALLNTAFNVANADRQRTRRPSMQRG